MKISEYFNIDLVDKPHIKVSKYKNLQLIRYYYEQRDKVNDEIDKYSRGMVISNDSDILLLPPIKSKEISIDEYFEKYSNIEVEPIIDGVMVNIFHDENVDEWILSTRGSLGGYNKWNKFLNFKDMFNECRNFEYDDLDKGSMYSFVVRHNKNRNVGRILYNEVYLVEMRDKRTLDRVNKDKYDKLFKTVDSQTLDSKDEAFKTYEFKGYTFYDGAVRYKVKNSLYEYVNELRCHKDKVVNYLELKAKNKVKEYLEYYPEEIEVVKDTEEKINVLVESIYMQYVNLKIRKNMEDKDVYYHVKPCIRDIHKNYIRSGVKVTRLAVKKYVDELPIYKLKFILNYI